MALTVGQAAPPELVLWATRVAEKTCQASKVLAVRLRMM